MRVLHSNLGPTVRRDGVGTDREELPGGTSRSTPARTTTSHGATCSSESCWAKRTRPCATSVIADSTPPRSDIIGAVSKQAVLVEMWEEVGQKALHTRHERGAASHDDMVHVVHLEPGPLHDCPLHLDCYLGKERADRALERFPIDLEATSLREEPGAVARRQAHLAVLDRLVAQVLVHLSQCCGHLRIAAQLLEEGGVERPTRDIA